MRILRLAADCTVMLALAFLGMQAAAQSSSKLVTSNAAQSDANQQGRHPVGREGSSGEAAREQDEERAFKLSPAIHWISEKTGLSLSAAYWLSTLVNFAIVALTIVWLLNLNLPAAFRNRSGQIKKNIADARRTSEEANRRLSEVEARLTTLDAEISAIHKQAEAQAKEEEERMRAEEEEEKRKIVDSARQEIVAISMNARRELKAFAANLAVNLAIKKINVDTATDKTLIREFASRMGRDGQN